MILLLEESRINEKNFQKILYDLVNESNFTDEEIEPIPPVLRSKYPILYKLNTKK